MKKLPENILSLVFCLVYFKKGTETYGNPVGTQCSPMLDVNEQPIASALQVRIVPNPLQNQAQVIIDGLKISEDLQFVLYNLVGREVYRMKVTGNISVLESNNLPAGLYLYMLTGKEIMTKGKLVIE